MAKLSAKSIKHINIDKSKALANILQRKPTWRLGRTIQKFYVFEALEFNKKNIIDSFCLKNNAVVVGDSIIYLKGPSVDKHIHTCYLFITL